MAGPKHAPFVDFLPSYDAGTFDSVPAPTLDMHHRVLIIGRVEINKGVFDLLELAIRLRAADRRIEFDLCGSGTAMEELQRRVDAAQIGDRFHLHGWCNQEQIREHFGRSTIVIVPTTTEFTEGFNMVVVEALLAGRPVITSDVCPALEYVRGAVREVPPDDVDAYYKALLELVDDRAAYERLQSNCQNVTQRFLDPRTGFAAGFRHFLEAARDGKRPEPLIHAP
jgi:glycosyltransferase involved in cell wall biosynthesis